MAEKENYNAYGDSYPDDSAVVESTQVDESVLDEDPTKIETQQVESTTVIYVPRKTFEASVNNKPYEFVKGVPHKVDRGLANMLLEDEDRGYIKE